ncbi:hypothetical protein [Teichococcus wenyumeiae]|uniref:hypothetical protein n=1 Tax=Teichococcus wenyumeiae TaxID=2478470 RepID=UPI0011C485CC|nr:hypothetical protein [Pseudoroseomonas wenyumeiae]
MRQATKALRDMSHAARQPCHCPDPFPSRHREGWRPDAIRQAVHEPVRRLLWHGKMFGGHAWNDDVGGGEVDPGQGWLRRNSEEAWRLAS